MVQPGKVLVAKPDVLGVVPRTPMVEGEKNQLP